MQTLCRRALALSFTLLGLVQAHAAPASPGNAAWLFTSFRGDGDALHLAYSYDGTDWTDLDREFFRPQVGSKLIRDPHVLRDLDGLYRMVWTTGWKDLGIGYATSRDLVHWSEQKFLPLMDKVMGAQSCWAPELFPLSDGSYLLIWSSAVPVVGEANPRFLAHFTITKDFVSYAEPRVLFDPGFGNIDSTLLYSEGKYRLVFKAVDDQSAKVWGPLHVAISDQPTGPFQLLPDLVVSQERVEGPAPVVLGDRTLVYFDHYTDHRYGVRETRDWKTWTDITKTAAVVKGQRHGSILAVPGEVVEALRRESASIAPPPILDGFTADPAIRVFGDKYYVYPTSDRPFWNTTEFAVWSSRDLVQWKKEGVLFDLTKDIEWANNQAWAPDCIERDGKYYLYFCGEGKIGVAVAPTPIGPFTDPLGHPLLAKGGKIKTNTIDPAAFIDDDGQAYLYFGNGSLTQVVKLRPDMITVEGDPIDLHLKEFREGIVVFKRGGKYYFMWSIDDARSPEYRVGWGVADSPFGPVTTPEKDFIVLRKNGPAQGTAHHSVVQVPGTDRWYVAYHRHAVPGGGGYKRETCLARMEFRADGSIQPMDPMVPAFKAGDSGEPLGEP